MNKHGGKVGSLGELPQHIAPARDLWPGIAAAIGATGEAAPGDTGAATERAGPPRRRFTPHPLLALAAAVSCVAVGVWLGRASVQPVAVATAPQAPRTVPVSYAPDARFERTRAELLRDVAARLAALPPESRAKIEASIADLQRARGEIEAALGRDPGNALLQAMLVNSYQDEMRVLAAVRDTWALQQEIGA